MSEVEITIDKTEAVLRAVLAMSGKQVLIGIPASENDRDEDPIGNAALGLIHDHGSPKRNIPARPFLEPGVKDVSKQILAALKQEAAKVLTTNGSIETGLTKAGLIGAAGVKKRIISQKGFAPLADSTLDARKRAGFSGESALIRTGQLLNAITFVVEDK